MATSIWKRNTFELEPEGIVEETVVSRKKKKIGKPAPQAKKRKLTSFKKSPDRYSFAHLAKVLTGGERIAMLNAVDRLQNRARVLVELACFSSFSFVRLAAISHLGKDIDALIEVAKFCQFEDTRAAALDDLSSNHKALVEVACSSHFKDTRLGAVSLLRNPTSLAAVASDSPKRDSRLAALEKIARDSSALKKVAKDSSYRSSRKEAVGLLSADSRALCALIVEAEHLDVKKASASALSGMVEELDDIDALVEIAKVSPEEDTRFLAIGRLSEDPYALRNVLRDARHRDARTTALMLISDLVADLEDEEMLAEIAISSPYEDVRAVAVKRLAGKRSALLSVATKSKHNDARELALAELEGDIDALKDVSKLSKYGNTRRKAHRIVSRPEVFEGELSRILG